MTNETYEHKRAIMEGECNASAEAWHLGMPMDSTERRFYEAGFSNGWDRALALPITAPGAEVMSDAGHVLSLLEAGGFIAPGKLAKAWEIAARFGAQPAAATHQQGLQVAEGAGEPTEEMVDALRSAIDLTQGDPDDEQYDDGRDFAKVVLRKVLAKAPSQSPAPLPEAQPVSDNGAIYAPLTLDEVRDLTSMQAGAPWPENVVAGVVELFALADDLRAKGKRPVDPANEKGHSHRWNDEGERCLKCGDKDWMADRFCSVSDAPMPERAPGASVPRDVTPYPAGLPPKPDALSVSQAHGKSEAVAYREWLGKFGGGWRYHGADDAPAGGWDGRHEPLFVACAQRSPAAPVAAEVVEEALHAFEQKERGVPQAHMAAALLEEVRAALAAAAPASVSGAPVAGEDHERQYSPAGILHAARVAADPNQGATAKHLRNLLAHCIPYLPGGDDSVPTVNRYCRAGMCLENDKDGHNADCPNAAPVPKAPDAEKDAARGPMTEAPERGARVWYFDALGRIGNHKWAGGPIDLLRLRDGRIFAAEADALAALQAEAQKTGGAA